MIELIDLLNKNKALSREQWIKLLSSYDENDVDYAASVARKIALTHFGNNVFIRGIIEISNICKNDCFYCGIRKSCDAARYRMDEDEILECCAVGYENGFRTFVLQGGEDGYFTTEELCGIVSKIRNKYPDCAITLSLGERDDYKELFDAGANRYLLRHETATKEHYEMLHPKEMSFDNRMKCLYELKEIGFQTGCGMMVGAPFQTAENLAEDMIFMGNFKPHMIGMGPFIPAKGTPFEKFERGSLSLTLFLISLCRIMLEKVLLPATTALGTIDPIGREKGILAGANVVMPNLSPEVNRKKYMLYDNKIGTTGSAADSKKKISEAFNKIGYKIVENRGDYK